MRVLIAGGTGFIGQRLTATALERGWEVHLLVRNPDGEVAGRFAWQGARLVKGDITQPHSLRAAFSETNPTHYFHNAGWYELGIPARLQKRMWAVNVDGLANALDAAGAHNVEKIVMTSSTTALGDTAGDIVDENFNRRAEPTSWYEGTLYKAQQVARKKIAEGLPIVMGSPAQVIGRGDHSVFGIMLRLYLRGLLPPILWAPEGAFSFVHVEDVAAGLVGAMEHGGIGENYFFTGSVMTNRDMLQTWKTRTGRSLPMVWMPKGLAILIGYLAAPLLRLAGQPAFISPEVVHSSYVSFRYSNEKARRELNVSLRPAVQAWADTIEAEQT